MKIHIFYETAKLFFLVTALAVIVSCASSPSQPLSQLPHQEMLWPQAPEPARIAFVKSFSQPEDLGFSRSFLGRIADFITGESELKLVRPMAIIADSLNNVYVADPGVKGVHRFSFSKGEHEVIRLEDDQPLLSPVAFALGLDDTVYVSDSALNQVFMIGPDSRTAQVLKLDDELKQPTGITFDSQTGQLIIVDTADHKIKVFNKNGVLQKKFGQRGDGEAEFNYPTMVWRNDQGHLFISDTLNFRVQEFDQQYNFIRQFGKHGDATGDFAMPKGIATSKYGHVYVVDSLFHAFQVFDETGKLLLYVGGQGQQDGEFWLPTGIFIGANDTIYIADSHNRRVQVFRYIGGGL